MDVDRAIIDNKLLYIIYGAIDAACSRLGYSSLREEQEEAVKNFASVLNMTA